jgi:hypothetical protein
MIHAQPCAQILRRLDLQLQIALLFYSSSDHLPSSVTTMAKKKVMVDVISDVV